MSTIADLDRYSKIYGWYRDAEDLERYQPGGYHPVTLETTFKSGRYHVVHKLGYGSFSTVWLARDTLENRYVSLKVLVAERPDKPSVETSIHERLNRLGDPTHPGRAHVQQSLDHFQVQGPNGTHTVLVGEVLALTALKLRFECVDQVLPVNIARRLTAQLALGLAYVHSCGIVHGDLHSKNVATTLPPLDDWQPLLSNVERDPIERRDGQPSGPGVPPYTIEPMGFWEVEWEKVCDGAKILDFGEAFLVDSAGLQRTKLNAPPPFRAPEAMFNEPVGTPADIWAFGCTVYDLWYRGGDSGALFACGFDFGHSDNGALETMVRVLGKLPDRWWKEWKWNQAFFHEDGSPKEDRKYDTSLANRVEVECGGGDRSEEDREGLLTLLRGCLKYEPGERMTAEDILRNEWVKKCLQ